jgi:hypothetical protein
MIKQITALATGVALAAGLAVPVLAQPAPTYPPTPTASPMSNMTSMAGSTGMTMEHGFPIGTAGPDGIPYTGAPDLQTAVSLVVAGGPVGDFSITKAITAMAGADIANAEVAKLTKQYGKDKVASFVVVQNFAINDAVKRATAAGVKFPTPELTGAELAKKVVGYGLIDGTYYEGTHLDHLVTNGIHQVVMADIDAKYGTAADANYHRIADQANVDLAHALGVTSVKLAAYH